MWASGRVQRETSELWSAGLAISLDCGEAPAQPTTRKKRGIVLGECLVKFAEGIHIKMLQEKIRSKLEPYQLGSGTPDGHVILLRLLQNWAADLEEDNIRMIPDGPNAEDSLAEIDFTGVAGTDLTNAYGRYFRSKTAIAAENEIPELHGAQSIRRWCH